jgi:hypothetical protein
MQHFITGPCLTKLLAGSVFSMTYVPSLQLSFGETDRHTQPQKKPSEILIAGLEIRDFDIFEFTKSINAIGTNNDDPTSTATLFPPHQLLPPAPRLSSLKNNPSSVGPFRG